MKMIFGLLKGIKTIDCKADDSSITAKRYRLMLSDGKNTFSCMKLIDMNMEFFFLLLLCI